MKKILELLFVLVLAVSSPSYATIINSGFESDLAGWTTNNPSNVSAATSYFASNGSPVPTVTILPTEGKKFALIEAGSPVTTLLSSPFFVDLGDTIKFDWVFSAEDYMPFNDYSGYSLQVLIGGVSVASNVLSQIASVGSFGLTGWHSASITAPLGGNMELQFYSVNGLDFGLPSVLGIDNIQHNSINGGGNPSSVPEPSSLALIGAGIIGIVGFSRRRKTIPILSI